MQQDAPRAGRQDRTRRSMRWSVLIVVYAAIFALGSFGGGWVARSFGLDSSVTGWMGDRRVLWSGLVLYVVLLAIPFVPGVEISIALFAAFGPAVAAHIYAATVIALLASFLVGRLLPMGTLAAGLQRVGLSRAAQLVRELEPLDRTERLDRLVSAAPNRLVPLLVRNRHLALALVLNLPGNAILGGGGGIALLAGTSGLYSIGGYLLAILVAVLPVPLAIFLTGRLM